MIDTHSHLLPWVDHGCPDLDTSLLMAREAAASGIHTVVCTPHLPEWDESQIRRTREVIEEVRAAVTAAGIGLTLLLGFEVEAGVAAFADEEALGTLAIEGSGGAIVLEMPYTGWPVYMDEAIFRLSTSGFLPVLAHPERNDRVQKSSDLMVGCIKAGAIGQSTAASLSGEFGRGPAQALRRLLSEGLIQLIASDAHAYRREGWTLAPMLAALAGLVSEETLTVLSDTNPGRLLAGESLLTVTAEGGSSGRSWRTERRRSR